MTTAEHPSKPRPVACDVISRRTAERELRQLLDRTHDNDGRSIYRKSGQIINADKLFQLLEIKGWNPARAIEGALRMNAEIESGEQKLCFAVIVQAVLDLQVFVSSHLAHPRLLESLASQVDARGALEFLEHSAHPYLQPIKIDDDQFSSIVNYPLGMRKVRLLDAARDKITLMAEMRRSASGRDLE